MSYLQGIQTIFVVVLICGLMFKPAVKFSTRWDSISQALYEIFLAVVGIISYTNLHHFCLLKLVLFHYMKNDSNPMLSYICQFTTFSLSFALHFTNNIAS